MKPPHQPPHRNGIYPEHTPESLLPLLNEVDKLHETLRSRTLGFMAGYAGKAMRFVDLPQ